MALGHVYGVDKAWIATLCTVTNHHTFGTTCSSLKKEGLIEAKADNSFCLTDKGVERIGGVDAVMPPESNDAAQELLKGTLKVSKSREMFDLLTDGGSYTRADIADRVGMDVNDKTFRTYVSYLSKLVEKVDGAKVRLKENAFPCGRPCDQK
jgi:hypothetical protein